MPRGRSRASGDNATLVHHRRAMFFYEDANFPSGPWVPSWREKTIRRQYALDAYFIYKIGYKRLKRKPPHVPGFVWKALSEFWDEFLEIPHCTICDLPKGPACIM
jgi:hypothetical protein